MSKATATINEKAGTLTIVIPINKPAKPSATGKTLLVASTGGAQASDVEVNGKELILNVNAYIYATDKAPKGE